MTFKKKMGLDVGQGQKRLCQHLGPYFYDLCLSRQKSGHLHNIWREKNILSGQVDDIPRFDGTYLPTYSTKFFCKNLTVSEFFLDYLPLMGSEDVILWKNQRLKIF